MKRVLFLFILGTLVFLVCMKFTPLGFLLSSLAGIGAIIGLRSLIKLIEEKRKRAEAGFEPDQEAADRAVKEGMAKIREMSNKTRMIRSNEVAAKVKEICRTGVKIFEDIKNNPDDLKKARQFQLYYLDATKKIIDQYVELSAKKEVKPEVEETLKRIEEILDSIDETFRKQLAYMLEDDLLDINTEITLLKKTMKLEG